MCGVLGFAIKDFGEEDYDLVRNLFIQSMVRGKHATGVSFCKNGVVHTIKEPVPANEFIAKQDLSTWRNEDGNLYAVGHIRYSTSDLRFNQPMATEEIAIAHNGVISQEPASNWEAAYGLSCETENDSELVLRALLAGQRPLEAFPEASMAVCTVDKYKRLTGFRNHQRPLYYSFNSKGLIMASTLDILRRAGIDMISPAPMFEVLTVDINLPIWFKWYEAEHDSKIEDLQ